MKNSVQKRKKRHKYEKLTSIITGFSVGGKNHLMSIVFIHYLFEKFTVVHEIEFLSIGKALGSQYEQDKI
jgi:hypothetical protein